MSRVFLSLLLPSRPGRPPLRPVSMQPCLCQPEIFRRGGEAEGGAQGSLGLPAPIVLTCFTFSMQSAADAHGRSCDGMLGDRRSDELVHDAALCHAHSRAPIPAALVRVCLWMDDCVMRGQRMSIKHHLWMEPSAKHRHCSLTCSEFRENSTVYTPP